MKGCNSGPARWKRCAGHSMWEGVQSSVLSERAVPGVHNPAAPAPLFYTRCSLPCTGNLVPWSFQPQFCEPTTITAPPSAGALWTSGNQVSGLHGQKALQYGCQGKGATQFTYLHTHRFLRKHKCKAEGNGCLLTDPQTQDLLLEKTFRTNVKNDVS